MQSVVGRGKETATIPCGPGCEPLCGFTGTLPPVWRVLRLPFALPCASLLIFQAPAAPGWGASLTTASSESPQPSAIPPSVHLLVPPTHIPVQSTS